MKHPGHFITSPEVKKYCERHTSPEAQILNELNRETHVNILNPRMLTGHVMGSFLRMVSEMIKPRRILEIGTYTGYSAICLASGLSDDGLLYTIEINRELEDVINRYIEKSGLVKKIIPHFGDACDIIPLLNEKFDLVFIDADKEQYPEYYQIVIEKVQPGGFVLVDNALWDGKVLNPEDSETKTIAEFNQFMQNDDRVENVLLPVRDGVMMIRKL
ncbi:MAG: class I SAM-dependent methyltransferase [Bacteroidales bacterium]|nr:class I SAM-dependent methyltransferase [Bacteroidales bacterium]